MSKRWMVGALLVLGLIPPAPSSAQVFSVGQKPQGLEAPRNDASDDLQPPS